METKTFFFKCKGLSRPNYREPQLNTLEYSMHMFTISFISFLITVWFCVISLDGKIVAEVELYMYWAWVRIFRTKRLDFIYIQCENCTWLLHWIGYVAWLYCVSTVWLRNTCCKQHVNGQHFGLYILSLPDECASAQSSKKQQFIVQASQSTSFR